MIGVCNQCGHQRDLCVCEAIAREADKNKRGYRKRKFGKKYTIISGIQKGSQHQRDIQDIEVKVCLRRNCQNRQNRASGAITNQG